MPQFRREEVLRLYKHLIRYGNQLQFTNKNYFLQRIREEFRKNSSLNSSEDIEYHFKVNELS